MTTVTSELPAVTPLLPRQPVPALDLPLASSASGGGRYDLAESDAESFTLVVFYRGLHCPICRTYLEQLTRLKGDFEARGVKVVAVSSDSRERAERTAAEWGVKGLDLAYGLPLETARAWGLYVSSSRGVTSIGVEEPHRFSEPGVFLVRPDGTLYFGTVQTMPFARPDFRQLLKAVDYVLENDYPARGEIV